MKEQVKNIIIYTTLIIIGIFFIIIGLYKAKSFLIPLTIAVLLSMVMLPVTKKFEKWGISRGLSVLFADLLILAFCAGLIFLLGIQVQGIASDWPKYKQKLQPKIEKIKSTVQQKTGISLQKQLEKQKQQEGQKGKMASRVEAAFSSTFSFLGDFLLVFVYIFFFMFYRRKFFNSFLKFFSEDKRNRASKTLEEFANVTQKYMFGRFILIIVLAVLYATGLSIIGVKHAIMISLIAAILSLVPYIGNLIGFGLALLMGVIVKGGASVILGVTIVFAFSQFVESYLLEPYLVGQKVNLNPVLVIVGVVAGGAIWGIAGMIVAIPIIGMFKVLFDSIPVLEPMGYLLGEEDISSEGGFFDKIKDKAMKIVKKK